MKWKLWSIDFSDVGFKKKKDTENVYWQWKQKSARFGVYSHAVVAKYTKSWKIYVVIMENGMVINVEFLSSNMKLIMDVTDVIEMDFICIYLLLSNSLLWILYSTWKWNDSL